MGLTPELTRGPAGGGAVGLNAWLGLNHTTSDLKEPSLN